MSVETSILYWFYGLNGTARADEVVRFLADSLPYLIAVAALVVLFIPTDRERRLHISRKTVLLFALASAAAARYVLTPLVRSVVPRERPFEALSDIQALISHEPGGSFPSGHAVFFFSLATVVWLHNRRLGAVFYILALVNGSARIAAGLHWPSDVVIGGFLGIVVGLLADRLLHAWRRRNSTVSPDG